MALSHSITFENSQNLELSNQPISNRISLINKEINQSEQKSIQKASESHRDSLSDKKEDSDVLKNNSIDINSNHTFSQVSKKPLVEEKPREDDIEKQLYDSLYQLEDESEMQPV